MDDHIRIEWRESRGDNLFIVIAEKRAGKWEFFERSSWETRWYPRAASFELVAQAESRSCVRGRALPVILSSALWGKEEHRPLAAEELGDYHDNQSILTRARKELAQGQVWTACQRLLRLQAHIYMTKDKQSAIHLLPDVEKLLRTIGYQSLSTFGVYSLN
jgi:hypothetical protein